MKEMIQIQQQKKTIKLNKSFYSKESVLAAMNDFSEICSLNLKETNSHFLIDLISKEENTEKIEFEFCNYCLSLMK